jgi:hypothetical protein
MIWKGNQVSVLNLQELRQHLISPGGRPCHALPINSRSTFHAGSLAARCAYAPDKAWSAKAAACVMPMLQATRTAPACWRDTAGISPFPTPNAPHVGLMNRSPSNLDLCQLDSRCCTCTETETGTTCYKYKQICVEHSKTKKTEIHGPRSSGKSFQTHEHSLTMASPINVPCYTF